MRNSEKISLLSKLNNPVGYVMIFFILTTASVAGEHFVPTLKYLMESFISLFVGGENEEYMENLRNESIFFVSKTGGIFFATLAVIVGIAFTFTPIIALTKLLQELTDEKNKHALTLREYNELQKNYIEFSDKVAQHSDAQLASVQRFQRVAETVNIEVSNGRHSVHELVVIIKQLQAVIAALGDELSPPEKTDQGGF